MKRVNGLFSDTLKKCSSWFLYIFIAKDAKLPAAIMRKRKNQIAFLRTLDRWNGVYNFDQLVFIIETGIKERYGMTPAQVLTQIYNTAISTTTTVSGLGEVAPLPIPTQGIDVKPVTMPTNQQIVTNLNNMQVKTATGSNTNLFDDIGQVVKWIIDLINAIGINKKTADNTPVTTDWTDLDKPATADISTYLPWVVGAAIVATLFSDKKALKSKTK
ncbi:MAG: hypothetical protein QM800_12740 [Paludibacter sp.]